MSATGGAFPGFIFRTAGATSSQRTDDSVLSLTSSSVPGSSRGAGRLAQRSASTRQLRLQQGTFLLLFLCSRALDEGFGGTSGCREHSFLYDSEVLGVCPCSTVPLPRLVGSNTELPRAQALRQSFALEGIPGAQRTWLVQAAGSKKHFPPVSGIQ